MFKLVSLKATGFKRLDIQDRLEFPDGRLLVHGRNESGKSTLMEAIHYGLYGQPLRPSKNAGNDDIICYGESKAIVELDFSLNDTQYQVRRELLRDKTNIHLLNKLEKDGKLTRITTGYRNVNDEISEILHGIDSDALLNSCLVEQKELGKLEAASKQDRIKAMSSLLNLEAFIDARDDLKTECSNLEKIHLETQRKLDAAEKAREEHLEAEKKRKQAEKRLTEISEEREKVEKTLKKLREKLEIIQEMKRRQNKINENKTKKKGKQDELELLREQLEEIKKAENALEEIEKKIPEAEEILENLDEQIKTLQRLSNLHEKLREIESKLENIGIRLKENRKAHMEAREAKKKIDTINEELEQYKETRRASEKIEALSSYFNQYTGLQREENRLSDELASTRGQLGESKTSESKIKELEEEITQAQEDRNHAQRYRTVGIVGITAGLLVLAYTLFASIWIGVAAGAITLALGGYLYSSNNPGELEKQVQRIQTRREKLLGDRARIQDYYTSIEEIESKLKETREKQKNLEESIIMESNQLPDQPRDYKSVLKLTEPDSVNKLRTWINEDAETYTRLTAQKNSLQEKAESLESITETLESIKKEKEEQQEQAEQYRKQITKIEKETEVSLEDDHKIRKEHTAANNKLTGLRTQKNSYIKSLERRPQVKKQITETSNELNLLTATIEQETKKLVELEKQGVTIADEPKLSKEREENVSKSAQLGQEEKERNQDIEESKKIIEKTKELKEQYPPLKEETIREKFRLESMRRATVLLDTTRDSIMGSVKQNVEKNMMQFLPTLTDNRYNMARIDETNYRIEVYDKQAKTWRGKGVFSGATQDQFSLALRLAFAISTIPSSRGARPGFIFLDEPLSGFDAQRRNGFMQLLREELSKHFDQVIVISHLEALAEYFTNSLTMDAGKIIRVQR